MKDLSDFLTSLGVLLAGVGTFLAGLRALSELVRGNEKASRTREEAPQPRANLFRSKLFLIGVSMACLGVVILVVAMALLPRRPISTDMECRLSNLLNCGTLAHVYVPGESLSSGTYSSRKLVIDFNNKQRYSGVAFLFSPALDVRGFSYVEFAGTSSQPFRFLMEYKVNTPLSIVAKSVEQSFPASPYRVVVKVPITYEGKVDEIIINFYAAGEFSTLGIESIRLIY